MNCCPTCGQPLLIRHGVKLRPKQAAILDMIERARGRGGVGVVALAGALYPGVETERARHRVRVQVSQINERLASTDLGIVRRHGLYCFASVPF
jgi:hypothetical protein